MTERPKLVANPDFSRVIEYTEEGIQSAIENEGYPGKDFNHYLFEAVMETLYGPNIWDWWNENTEGC